MEFLLLFVLLTSQLFASVTPTEKEEAMSQAHEVMLKFDGEELNGKVSSTRVADELGTRIIVEFTYVENVHITRKCSYVFDRVLKRVVKDSWLCEL